MRTAFRITAITTAAVVAFSLAGCTSADGGAGESLVYKPGVVISLTGDLSAFGPSYAAVDQLAIDDIEAAIEKSGTSDSYSVDYLGAEDDQTDATAGVEAANKLVAEGANVIIGSLGSALTAAIANGTTIPNGILQVAPGATATSLTTLEDGGLLYRTVPSDAATASALAAQLADELGADATVNIGVRNDAFGTGFQEAFTAEWEELGGTVGASIAWDPAASAFDTEAQELVAGDPDAWVVIDFPTTWSKVGPALVRTGKWDAARTFTNQGLSSSDLASLVGAEASEGMRGIDPTTSGEQAAALQDRFAESNPDDPYDAFAPNNYDAVVIPFLAMVAAGSDTSADMAASMSKVTEKGATVYTSDQLADAITALAAGDSIDYQGPAGPLNFDENGDPAGGTFESWVIKDGAVEVTGTFEHAS